MDLPHLPTFLVLKNESKLKELNRKYSPGMADSESL